MKTACSTALWTGLICTLAGSGALRAADIPDDQLNSLKEMLRKQGEAMQKLSDQVQELQKEHQQDVDQIKQLEQRLQTPQIVVTNMPQQAVEAAVEGAPLPRIPIDEASVNHSFSVLGDAEFQFAHINGMHPTFLFADFAPIFLYRGGDNVLFEAGFDFTLQNAATTTGSNGTGTHDSGQTTGVNLSFAQLDYIVNDHATLAVGNLLLPLGTYSLRTAGWLNKIPDDPLPRDLVPGSGVGGEVLGAFQIGSEGKQFNYSIWGVNGPSSSDGTGAPDQLDLGGNVGLTSDNRVTNLHGSPSGGARLGVFFPFKPHYDFELGLSGQSGEWDDAGNHLWNAAVVDASVHLGSYFETKGEFINTWYGSDSGNIHPEGWWIQSGYKLAGLNLLNWPLVNNVELMGRYDTFHDGLGVNKHRETVGYVYYLSNTLLFEGDYEFFSSNSGDPNEKNRLILQLSYGF